MDKWTNKWKREWTKINEHMNKYESIKEQTYYKLITNDKVVNEMNKLMQEWMN